MAQYIASRQKKLAGLFNKGVFKVVFNIDIFSHI